MEELTMGEVGLNINPTVMEEVLTLFDAENSSVVFKGVLDQQTGALFLDPSQFANLIMEQPHGIETSSGMTIQMISMPQTFPLHGKSILNGTSPSEDILSFSTSDLVVSASYTSENLGSMISTHPTSSQIIRFDTVSTSASCISSVASENYTRDKVKADPTVSSKAPRSKAKPVKLTPVFNVPPHNIEPPIGNGPFRCAVCPKEFPKWLQLRRHKAVHLDEKAFRCRTCSMTFNFEINFKLHTMLHEAEETSVLQCQLCPAKFSRLASLKSHLRVHEKDENLVCPECGDEFPTKARLENHLEEHRTRVHQCMLHRCKLCGKNFTALALLRDHSKEHAAVRKELKVFGSKQKRRAKPKKSTQSSNFDPSSLSKQDRSKSRVCIVCSKRFQKPSQLDRHMRIHTGEKPFLCTQCGKSFNQKGTLEAHVLATHDLKKPHQCHLCKVGFSQRGNLKAHILKVHVTPGETERVFQCEECSCVYRRLATLNNHIAKSHAVESTSNNEIVAEVVQIENTTTTAPNFQPPTVTETVPPVPLVPANSMVTSNAEQLPQQTTNELPCGSSELVHEVNCVYDDEGTSKRLLVKVKRVGQVKMHMCPNCPKTMRKPSDLIRHLRVHTQERPFSCKVCQKSFAVKSTLNTHLKIHDSVKLLVCSYCTKRFSVLSSLKSHERLHTGAKPFQCMQCGKKFRTSSQRRVHMRTHSRNSLGLTGKRKLLRIGDVKSEVELPDPLRITSTGLVPVPNRALKSLVSRALVDQRTRPYKCTHCPCAFKKSSHLKQHIRSHTGEKPYTCLKCHRSFVSSGVLKNHIKTHEGVRAFTCITCKLAFTTNGSLTRHLATHNDDRLFVCPFCRKTFKTSVACRKHIKIHTNEVVAFNSNNDGMTQQYYTTTLQEPVDNSGTPTFTLNQHQGYDAGVHNTSYDDDFSDVTQVLSREMNSTGLINQNRAGTVQSDNNVSSNSIQQEEQLAQEAGIIGVPCPQSVTNNPDGTVTVQYSISRHDGFEGQHDTNFDPSLFLQGESLDLQFLPDPQHSAQCLEHIQTYAYHQATTTSAPESVVQIATVSTTVHEPQKEPESILGLPTSGRSGSRTPFSVKRKEKESDEVSKIRESSRPISERIYTQLTTQPYVRRPKDHRPLLSTFSSLAEKLGQSHNQCQLCQRSFKKKSDLQRHVRIHTGEKPFRCTVCGKAFRVKSTREAHMRTHQGGKTVSCHMCNNLFATKSSLRVHMRLHTGAKPYPCSHCDKWFRTSGHRKAHVQSHFKLSKETGQNSNGEQLGPGETIRVNKRQTVNLEPQEELNITSALAAAAVESTHQQEQLHVIGSLSGPTLQFSGLDLAQMDETFLQNVTNVIFLPQNHSGTDLVSGASGSMIIGMLPDVIDLNLLGASADHLNGSLSLSTAGDMNVNQYILNNNEMMSSTARHVGSTTTVPSSSILPGPPNKVCTFCDKAFSRPSLLARHLRTHTGLRPYQCSECKASFSQKNTLDTHKYVHSNDKRPIHCNLCEFTTVQKASLRTHFSRAHPEDSAQFLDENEPSSDSTIPIVTISSPGPTD